jgi:uncharacterized Fe-S center protein
VGEKDRVKKVVFFTDLNNLHDAVDNFNIKSFENQEVPVKLHLGEDKNRFFSRPDFVKHTIDELKKVNSKPFLYDTTVAYSGLRSAVSSYKKLALKHGFTMENVGCDIVIDDKGFPVKIENRDYMVAKHIFNSTHIFAVTHVKAHVATGMGGAIKNFGMGGVTKETKRKMHHGSKPIYQKDACTYCGICAEVCPFDALSVKNNSWSIEKPSCFGCGVCVENCNSVALEYDDSNLQFVLACAAKACVQDKNVIYLNELKRIADSCDCDSYAKNIICPDIGYLVSDDIVAVDKASLDLINNIKKDIFEKTTHINPIKQIEFGEEIGLGSSNYQLIEI